MTVAMRRDDKLERLKSAHYTPNRLLNELAERFNARSDRALGTVLGIDASAISAIRRRQRAVSPALMLKIHDVAGLTVDEIRALMGGHFDN